MVLLPKLTRKFLADVAEAVAKADSLDDAVVKAFVADMKSAGLYGEATPDEIDRLDKII